MRRFLCSFDNFEADAYDFDVIIVGSGVAGLYAALHIDPALQVALVTKANIDESNSYLAQGGIAAVMTADDNYVNHIDDTLKAGAGLCNVDAVKVLVEEGPENIRTLIDMQIPFDVNSEGDLQITREGGHRMRRIVHCGGDATGKETTMQLGRLALERENLHFFFESYLVDILTADGAASGVLIHVGDDYKVLRSRNIIIATGGIGQVFAYTTNPLGAVGDGIAAAARAGARVCDMELIQFHPTTLYNPGEKPNFLITEAMRGFGAILRLPDGQEFMDKYHPMKSLAPRDVVARAIYREMTKRGSDFVYLDVTHKDPDAVRSHFPNIYEKCRSIGIDITKDWIPVTPAAHYCCGGVKVDLNGETSIKRLYALGETSCTGLHGANRLASNSLIEAVVYADQAARHTAPLLDKVDFQEGIPDWDFEGTQHTEEMLMIIQSKREMQTIMSNYVGIVRSNLSLKRAMRRLEILWQETEELYNKTKPNRELCELRNMIAIAYLVIKQGREIKESVGCHYNADYPKE